MKQSTPFLPALLLLGIGFAIPATTLAENVEESFHQTLALSSNGIVSLQNVNGSVRFSTWDRNEVQVDAVKHGKRKSDLDAVKIETEAKPGGLRIETKYPKFNWGPKNSAWVEYEIKVPVDARLNDVVTVNGDIKVDGVHGQVRAATVNGRINLNGLRADAHLESVNGPLEAVYDKFESVESLSAKSVNGGIRLSLPVSADAEVTANTLNGSIQADPMLTVQRHVVGTKVQGNLGKGGGSIHAETVNGSISILRGEPSKNTAHTSASKAKEKAEAD